MILLYYVAAGFAELNLANPNRALGLPEGSVRALIALFLIMIFIIVSVYLFRIVSGQTGIVLRDLTTEQVVALGERVIAIEQLDDKTFAVTLSTGISEAGEQLALQLATILGTLVTAVSAFYFGSASSRAQTDTTTLATNVLTVDSVTPNSGSQTETELSVEIAGSGFVAGARVRLQQDGASDINAINVNIADASRIKCTFDLSTGQVGEWNLVVINPDGGQAERPKAFQIT